MNILLLFLLLALAHGDRVPSHLIDANDPNCAPEKIIETCVDLCGEPDRVAFCPSTCHEWNKKPIRCKPPSKSRASKESGGFLSSLMDGVVGLKNKLLGKPAADAALRTQKSGQESVKEESAKSSRGSSVATSSSAGAAAIDDVTASLGRFDTRWVHLVDESLLAKNVLQTKKYMHSELGRPKFVRRLVRDRQPALLSNMKELKEQKMMRWNPKRLGNRIPKPIAVRHRTENGRFSVGCCEVEPIWVGEMFQRDDGYYHLSSPLELLGERVQKDTTKRSLHFLESYMDDVDYKYVWLATHNCSTPMHYDPFENFNVQIYGHKMLTLAPPTAARSLYVHPKGHVRHRQAQADFHHVDLERFPRIADLVTEHSYDTENYTFPLRFIMEPGDVVYIPAYWFHEVTTIGPSISLNRWHVSHLSRIMDQAWNVQLPFSKQFSPLEAVATLRLFVAGIIDAVLGAGNAKPFIGELIETRYRPLYGEPKRGIDVFEGVETLKDPHCEKHATELEEIELSLAVPETLTDYCSFLDVLQAEENGVEGAAVGGDEEPRNAEGFLLPKRKFLASLEGPGFETAIWEAAKHFTHKDLDLAVRDIHLQDLIDDLVGQAVGDKNAYAYLQDCFIAHPPPINDGSATEKVNVDDIPGYAQAKPKLEDEKDEL